MRNYAKMGPFKVRREGGDCKISGSVHWEGHMKK